ncbi:MAG: transglycosylase SLT domain-containing protein [Muribaculaceae bacterium]|nr:transglycosylase SLT domain-containing protein [Muribaculaceae bacterium]
MARYSRYLAVGAVAALAATSLFTIGCRHSGSRVVPDTIYAATMYGPASYFYYRDTIMGYDHDMMEELASGHNRVVEWVIVSSLDEAVEQLYSGEVNMIVAPVPVDGTYDKRLRFCGPSVDIEQVLVQPPGDTVVVDVNQLAGRVVYVEKDSKGAKALEQLNSQMGDSIIIRPVDPDSIATEDMLESVAHGDIHLAVVDHKTARLNKSYFPELNITLALSEPEVARWAVASSQKSMADTIDAWCAEAPALKRQTEILQKYFDSRKNFPVEGASYDRQFRNGYASPFDSLFRVHADESAWDWRMLAAQAYQESRFDPTARSWAGAKGLMQIMPGTATGFGLRHTELTDPSRSIQTAVKILDAYDSMLATKVTNPIERKKFTLAAYNAGPGHVLDAIRLAEKYGLDPQVWDDNVEKAMLMKMNRRYYRDPVVKYGYSRGRETVDYVKKIYSYYNEVKEKIPYHSI